MITQITQATLVIPAQAVNSANNPAAGVAAGAVAPANLIESTSATFSDGVLFDSICCSCTTGYPSGSTPTKIGMCLNIMRSGQAIWSQFQETDLIFANGGVYFADFAFADNFSQPLQFTGSDNVQFGIAVQANQAASGQPAMQIAAPAGQALIFSASAIQYRIVSGTGGVGLAG